MLRAVARGKKPLCTVTASATQQLKQLILQHQTRNAVTPQASQSGLPATTTTTPQPPNTSLPTTSTVAKLGIVRKGCNGLSYKLSLINASECHELDEIVTTNDKNVTLVIDRKAVMFLAGVRIDFSETELSSRFIFNNPNQKASCGCGNSFSV